MIGTRLGPYEITAKLGEGGMGVVYRAKDSQLGRAVALKVLPEGLTADPERAVRFEREAKLLAQLNHPNIAQIHGFAASGEIRALVMELVEGPTLAERLESGALSLTESLSIARQISEALEEAHEKGIVHRDLKPQNVKAPIEGKVKVLDFGLAKAMDPTGASGVASASQLAESPTLTLGATVQGVILGTAAYMSPEQARGLAVDKRADIWAFGVVLHEMLTGRRLFSGDTVPEVLAEVIKSDIDLGALPAEVPPAIRRLVRRCLERRPQDRLRDIGDARIVLGETIAASGEPMERDLAPAVRPIGRRLAVAFAIAAALALGWLAGRSKPTATGGSRGPGVTSVEKLTFQPGVESEPALSPDGKLLYFVADSPAASDEDIYFVPVGGSKPINLTADSRAHDWSPAVSPDGELIAFCSDRAGAGIFLMGPTGESVRRLVDDCFHPAWSPDGQQIACTSVAAHNPFDRGPRGRLRLVDVGSGASRELPTGDAIAPAWSPTGRYIAYWGLSEDASGWRDLYLVAVAGGTPIRLTDDAAVDWNPVWSEDGSRLYFLSDRGGAPNLWRLEIDATSGQPGKALESVILPTEYVAAIARAGDRWVYAAHTYRATIERIGFDPERLAFDESPVVVMEITSRLQSVAPSPDGETLAYSIDLPRQDVFLVSADGGKPVQLTNDSANDRHVAWDARGERILFMSNRSGTYEIWALRADGSGLEQLTETEGSSAGWSPRLSPDLRRLATRTILGTLIFDTSGAHPWTMSKPIRNSDAPDSERFHAESWSPDGRHLAGYLSTSRGEERKVGVWSFETGALRELDACCAGLVWLEGGARLLALGAPSLLYDLRTDAVQSFEDGRPPGWFGRFSADARTAVGFRNLVEADLWLAAGIE